MSKENPKDKKCEYNNFKRARYFHGMLLTDRDFREEQIYHNEKRRLLNRMLHGWGVVCGLKVKTTSPQSSKIIIEPGLALDCAGNEIFICEPYELDVLEIIKSCSTPKKQLTEEEKCIETEARKLQEDKWYVVIKYQEVPTDPVPVYAPGGGCEERVCEYSRIREGYCIELCQKKDLTVPCPDRLKELDGPCAQYLGISKDEKGKEGDIRKFLCEDLLMPCPGDCCDNAQVVLGSITFQRNITSATKITTDMINNWDCRKYVITFSLLQHWMRLFAPLKVPLEAIADYAMLADACKTMESAVTSFRGICKEEKVEAKKK